MSADGRVVAGDSQGEAVVWTLTPAIRVQTLSSVLQTAGISITGWRLSNIADISADGKSLVGWGVVAGNQRAFLVTGLALVPDPCGDLFVDGIVNGADLGILLSQWGSATASTVSDLNRDGRVNGADLGILLNSWGPCSN
jgi:hypothetical protein